MKRYNSYHTSGHVIGKANKYWTWWEVTEPIEKEEWYGTKTVQFFNYHQNLSFEKEKAIQKLKDNPDVNDFVIDESLRGSSSYSKDLGIDYHKNIFLFGTYKKKKFSDVDDTDYKRWYWSETKGTYRESPVLKKQLQNLLIEFDGETIFIDELKDKALKLYEENFRRKGLFGNEGDKFENYVRFRKTYSFETIYGIMHVYEFVDSDGRLFYYKGSKVLDIEENIIYILKGKIKHNKYYSNYHNEFVEETQIQYPKIEKAKK